MKAKYFTKLKKQLQGYWNVDVTAGFSLNNNLKGNIKFDQPNGVLFKVKQRHAPINAIEQLF